MGSREIGRVSITSEECDAVCKDDKAPSLVIQQETKDTISSQKEEIPTFM